LYVGGSGACGSEARAKQKQKLKAEVEHEQQQRDRQEKEGTRYKINLERHQNKPLIMLSNTLVFSFSFGSFSTCTIIPRLLHPLSPF